MGVAVYSRASIDRTEMRISVDRQTDRCQALAEQNWPGETIVTFSDNNLSGSNPDIDRPGYNRLLEAIRRGDITQLVVHEQSRLTRQPAQWDELVVALSRAGIRHVHTVLRGVVPVAEGNRLVGRIMAVVDADESERLRLRALAMHEHLAAQGRPNGGRYYGYRRQIGIDGRPTLHRYEPEAVIVERICRDLLAGVSANQVADLLTAENTPTGRAGRRWWATTVIAVARRPHIAGLRSHNRQIVGEGNWEPIITRERWEALQLAVTGRSAAGTNRAHRWLLTGGIAVCGQCRAPMIVGMQRRAHGYIHSYICSPRSRIPTACTSVSLSPAHLVEDIVAEGVVRAFESPDMYRHLAGGNRKERQLVASRLVEAERRVSRAAELFGAGEVDEATWRKMHAPASEALAAARAELAALSPADLPPLDGLAARWEGLALGQRRQLVGLAVEKVIIAPNTGRRPQDHRVRVEERIEIVWR